LITAIEGDWMFVKVPTGTDCDVCQVKSACTFQGPDAAYRMLRVARVVGCAVGDRVWVEQPASVLGIGLLALAVLPVALVFAGYALSVCCFQFPYANLLLWVIGIAVWLVAIYGTNQWLTHAPRFQTTIRLRGFPRSEQPADPPGRMGE